MCTLSRAASLAVLSLAARSATAQVFFTPFRPYNGLGDGAFTVRDVDATGTVFIGDGALQPGSLSHALRWTIGTDYQDLGLLPFGNWPTPYSLARAVSAGGGIVVGLSYSSASQGNRAFRWTEQTGMVDLGITPLNAVSAAFDMTPDGTVVVGSVGADGFRWTPGGGTQNIGRLPGSTYTTPLGISDDGGVIIGYGGTVPASARPWRWTSEGGMVPLPTLSGYSHHFITGISGDGHVAVGYVQASLVGGSPQAVRWTDAGDPVLLPTLPGVLLSRAFAASQDGSIIVGSRFVGQVEHAVFWNDEEGMVDLAQLLISSGVDMTGWLNLGAVTGISADDGTMVGTTVRRLPNGNLQTVPWAVRIPAPASGLLMPCAFAAIASRRRSHLVR